MAIATMFYGVPGVGKTVLAMSAPNAFLIDLDGGVERVPYKNRCKYKRMTSYAEIKKFIQSEESKKYSTIIIDTYGQLIEAIGVWVSTKNPRLKTDSGYSQQGWNAIKNESQKLVDELLARDQHTIFIAHSREDQKADVYKIRPDIAGASGKYLPQKMDLIGYMEIKNDLRTIHFSPKDEFFAKGNRGVEGSIVIPDNLDNNPNDFFRRNILRTMHNYTEDEQEIVPDYEEANKKFQDHLEFVSDMNTLKSCYDALDEAPRVWDSYIKNLHLLEEKTEDLFRGIKDAEQVNNFFNILKSMPAIWNENAKELKRSFKRRTDKLNLTFNKETGVFA